MAFIGLSSNFPFDDKDMKEINIARRVAIRDNVSEDVMWDTQATIFTKNKGRPITKRDMKGWVLKYDAHIAAINKQIAINLSGGSKEEEQNKPKEPTGKQECIEECGCKSSTSKPVNAKPINPLLGYIRSKGLGVPEARNVYDKTTKDSDDSDIDDSSSSEEEEEEEDEDDEEEAAFVECVLRQRELDAIQALRDKAEGEDDGYISEETLKSGSLMKCDCDRRIGKRCRRCKSKEKRRNKRLDEKISASSSSSSSSTLSSTTAPVPRICRTNKF